MIIDKSITAHSWYSWDSGIHVVSIRICHDTRHSRNPGSVCGAHRIMIINNNTEAPPTMQARDLLHQLSDCQRLWRIASIARTTTFLKSWSANQGPRISLTRRCLASMLYACCSISGPRAEWPLMCCYSPSRVINFAIYGMSPLSNKRANYGPTVTHIMRR